MSFFVLAFVVSLLVSCSLFLGAMLLIHCFEVPDNSRIVLSIAYFSCAALWTVWLVAHFLIPNLVTNYPILSPFLLGFSVLFISLVSLYSLEVKRPRRATTWKHLLAYSIPCLVMEGLLLSAMGNYHVLEYGATIGDYIEQYDVFVRILALVYIMVYSLLVLTVSSNSRRSSATNEWELRWFVMQMILVALITLSLLTNARFLDLIMLIYLVLFTAMLAYSELEVRIVMAAPPSHANRKIFEAHKKKLTSEEDAEDAATPSLVEARNAQLWKRIERVMSDERVWRSPTIDINTFSMMVFSNRTYVSQCISEHYEGGFKEMVNRYRIAAVKAKVDAGCEDSWNDLFYEVGFRSRTTAWRNFALYVGVTPAEYRP